MLSSYSLVLSQFPRGRSAPNSQVVEWRRPHPTHPDIAAAANTPGKRLVAWLVSNCRTDSKRELYVRELQKHVQVDVFGACGKRLECGLGRDECFTELARGYRCPRPRSSSKVLPGL